MPEHDSSAGRPAVWNRQRIFELLCEAGSIALDYRQHLRRQFKADASIVTQADCDIEQLLARQFDAPSEGVYLIGEETIESRGEDYIRAALEGTAYVIDPIDGTAPYAHQQPHWGISIGRMEAGYLTDGAIYLPEIRAGEMVINEGTAVLEGINAAGGWSWRELEQAAATESSSELISISQDMAKCGRVPCTNPVQALGTAVLPLVGIMQGRFTAYIGRLKLWDCAGCLPLLDRLGYTYGHLEGSPPLPMGLEVTEDHYEMDPSEPVRWRVRGGLLVCAPARESWLRDLLER